MQKFSTEHRRCFPSDGGIALIDTQTVLNTVIEYYSPDADAAELLPLCEAACLELSAMVKPEADLRDFRIINTAAAFAYQRFCVKRLLNDGGMTSFKAGDVSVSVSRSELAEYAKKEKSAALVAAAPLLKDNEFHFGQVRV